MEQRTIKVSRKKLVWAVTILAIIGLWWAYQKPDYQVIPMMGGGYGVSDSVSSPASSPGAPMMEKVGNMIYPDYYRQNPDITDTRQFLKTSYSADVKTRDVKGIVREVRGIINVAEGRIDSVQESEKYSYVGFVVPKNKFENFRDEIESLTYKKLVTVNVSSVNLLGQKQSIEEQMQYATSTLANLEKQKRDLTANHKQVLVILNADLATLEGQVPYPTNAVLIQKEKIDSENRSYSLQNQNLTNSINQYKATITGIEKQDTQFGNNIETINGYISVSWISYWQMARVLSPIHPSIIIIVLLAILWKILSFSRVIPKIELV